MWFTGTFLIGQWHDQTIEPVYKSLWKYVTHKTWIMQKGQVDTITNDCNTQERPKANFKKTN